jgi:AbiU2
VTALDENVRRAEPLWKKVRVLRNRAFGHRSKAHPIEKLFKEANIKISYTDDIKNFLDMSKEILNNYICMGSKHSSVR